MSANLNGKFRPKKVNFAQVSNTVLQSTSLSLKAKGLYSLIQSLITIPGMDLKIYKIRIRCKEKDKAFENAWKELKTSGYLKQYRIPSGKSGTFIYEYELLDIADLSTPSTINLNHAGEIIETKSTANNKFTKSNDVNNGNEGFKKASKNADVDHTPPKGVYGQSHENHEENQDDHTPHLAPYALSTLCSKHPLLNGGGNSNTLLSNTLLSNTKSVCQSEEEDGQTDEMREKIKEQIEYDYFEDNYPDDILGIDAIVTCMTELLSRPNSKVNGVLQSRETLEPYINHVDSCTVMEFIEHMRNKDLRNIKNVSSYWRSAFVNYIREQALLKLSV